MLLLPVGEVLQHQRTNTGAALQGRKKCAEHGCGGQNPGQLDTKDHEVKSSTDQAISGHHPLQALRSVRLVNFQLRCLTERDTESGSSIHSVLSFFASDCWYVCLAMLYKTVWGSECQSRRK